MPLQQLYEPRLGLLYRYFTVLDQPFQPVYFGKNGVVFGLSLIKFRLAPLFLIVRVNHRGTLVKNRRRFSCRTNSVCPLWSLRGGRAVRSDHWNIYRPTMAGRDFNEAC